MSTKTLIVLGMKCPRPLLEISKSMKTLERGEVLEVHADDAAFPPDVEAWCRRTGNTLLELQTSSDRYTAKIKKVQ